MFDVAHNATLGFPNRDNDAPDCERSIMRQPTLVPFGSTNRAMALLGGEAVMATILGHLPVGQPSQLRRELVRLRSVAAMVIAKSVFQDARDLSLEPAEVIKVGNHPFTRLSGD